MLALEYYLSSLITHNSCSNNFLERSLLGKQYSGSDLKDLSNTGFDPLSNYIKYNPANKEEINNYMTTILKQRLDLLKGTKQKNYLRSDLINESMKNILTTTKLNYDLILTDIESPMVDFDDLLIKEADFIVINVNQNTTILEKLELIKDEKILKKCFVIVGLYNKNSIYNVNNIKRFYKIKNEIGVIPYNREFADSCNKGKVIDFIIKNQRCLKNDQNYYFINETRKTVAKMLKFFGSELYLKKIGDENAY